MFTLRYLRYRVFGRLRYSRKFKAWLDAQASRLDITSEEVFNLLKGGMTTAQVEQKEPEPEIEPEGD